MKTNKLLWNEVILGIAKKYSKVLVILSFYAIIIGILGPVNVRILQITITSKLDDNNLILYIFAFALTKIMTSFGEVFINYIQKNTQLKIMRDSRIKLYKIISSFEISSLDENSSPAIVEKFSVLDNIIQNSTNTFLLSFRNMASFFIAIYFIAQFSLLFIFIATIPIPFWFLFSHLLSVKMKSNKNIEVKSRSKVYEYISSIVNNMESIMSFNNAEAVNDKYSYYQNKYSLDNYKSQKTANQKSVLNSAITNIPRILIMLLAAFYFPNTVSIFITVLLISGYIYKPVIEANMIKDTIISLSIDYKHIDEYFATFKYDDISSSLVCPNELSIQMSGVSFSYSDNRLIFNNIDVDIPEKTCVAIIGNSGVGKTSFIKLILGILIPTQGDVYIGKTSTKIIDKYLFWSKIAYMSQQNTIYTLSVMDNICLGVDYPEEKIIDICKLVNIYDDILNMNDKFNTMLFENGRNISGGQAQRICLARALIKSPDILIFDEPTSSVDNENEEVFVKTINEIKKEKTVVIISHRPKLLSLANSIYKIQSGKLFLD